MPGHSFTEQLDIPLLLVIVFFLFFLGLVYYLRSEDKREGYPLESDRTNGRVSVVGFPPMPKPKFFQLADGTLRPAPHPQREREINAAPAYEFPGAPLVPLGDPLVDGVGPASYALKEDVPDLTADGALTIVPMRNQSAYRLEETGPNLVGMTVIAADGLPVGTIADLWINATEYFLRYVEIDGNVDAGGRRIMAPFAFASIKERRGEVHFSSLSLAQFSRVPALASADQITKREEDRLNGYFAGGFLYGKSGRKGPFV